MNLSRRRFFAMPLLLSTSTLLGCTTFALLSDHNYTETISSILISIDKKHFVILTSSWHYIFDAPQGVVESLEAPFHKDVSAKFGVLFVNSRGETSLDYTLMIPKSAIKINQKLAISTGYLEDVNGNLLLKGNMTGVRYSPSNVRIPVEMTLLNQTYKIDVSASQTNLEKAVKLPLTPITLAVDGVLLVNFVPLAILFGFTYKGP